MSTIIRCAPGTPLSSTMKFPWHIVVMAQRQDLQKRQRFLGLLERGNVLQDRFGFTVLCNDQRLPVFGKVCQNLGGIGFEIADRLDLR